MGNPLKEFKNSINGLKQSLDGVKQSVDGLKARVDELKGNMQETLGEAKSRSNGVKSELGRMKTAVNETKAVLTEVRDTIKASAKVLYTQKRYQRLLGRRRKLQTAKAARPLAVERQDSPGQQCLADCLCVSLHIQQQLSAQKRRKRQTE